MLLADLDVGTKGETAMSIAREASQRIAGAIAGPIQLRRGTLSVRASIGCAVFPSGAGDARSLLRLADEDMYARKRERPDGLTKIRELA